MDLSFINVPTSKDELLAVLNIAYEAGQKSVGTNGLIAPKIFVKSNFKEWLSRLAQQWEDLKHS
jgi:hypothetical protein